MIYCVEDDKAIRELIVYTLNNMGYTAEGFENAVQFHSAIKKNIPLLVLLDIMLPDEDGITILKKIRSASLTKQIPVILLTAKNTEYDKVTGLDSGADDYIAKPFGMMELVSRIKAVLRRYEKAEDKNEYTYKGISLNTRTHTVTVFKEPVTLTLKEFDLLLLLLKNIGTVLTRDMLLEKIWGYDYTGETRTVDVHIRTLREKLRKAGDYIETVRGVGYKLNNERM